MEEKDVLKKMSKLFEDAKTKKITDFDSGLLAQSFESVTGSPEDRYEKWCVFLVNVASRLENLHKNDKERLPILKEIDNFFKEKLPEIQPQVSDYSQNSRIIKLYVDNSPGISSIPESLEATIKSLREEHYNILSNKAKILLAKARGRLDEDLFLWHQDELIEDVR